MVCTIKIWDYLSICIFYFSFSYNHEQLRVDFLMEILNIDFFKRLYVGSLNHLF